ncbi:MAG: peptidoglycan-binding domain-containing protein, partial [Chloroflexota bacterium]
MTLFLVLGLMALSAAISWVAASRIISPAEAAARTAPPTPSPILVPVEERVLTSDIVTRGTARFGLPQTISLIPSALKPQIGVISTLPLRNTQLEEGDVILTASGRPVFILQGDAPAYRDLVPGNSGEDVHQLEQALKRLGFDPGVVDKTYDEQTSVAVTAWYDSAGWEPFGPTPNQLATIRTLEQDLALAKNRRAAAYDAVATADLAIEAARANAESANIAASADVGVKSRIKDRVGADRENNNGEARANAAAALAAAQAAETAARSAGQAAIQAAVDAQRAAAREAKLAADAVARIEADLEAANG